MDFTARLKWLPPLGPKACRPALFSHLGVCLEGHVCSVCVCSFLAGGSEKLLRVCLNLPYFLRYINRFQDAVSANSFFIMPATVADATAVRNG